MRSSVPLFALAAVALLSGCASDRQLAQDIRQTRLQAESLNQRVDQLESSRGGGSVAYAAETDSSSSYNAGDTQDSTDTTFRAGGAFPKLGRGAVNTVTGWVEVPKRIHETAQRSGTWAGISWGLLRGLGYGFVRTAAWLYEVFTFPFPAPPAYRSVIQPAYVFTS